MFSHRHESRTRYLAWIVGAALCVLSYTTHAGVLLTEIHYNGPTAGIDPDEFLELSNPGSATIDLSGFSFGDGITFTFPSGTVLESQNALVIARDASSFTDFFPLFRGLLFDFGGSLSNGGETLSLRNANSTELWSVLYDDNALWPQGADGAGDSLQLIPGAMDLSDGASWLGAPPTPGQWSGFVGVQAPTPAPLPPTVLLLALGLLWLRGSRRA